MTKHLLFNLSLLILILFISRLFIERYPKKNINRIVMFFGFTISLLVCLWFSAPINGDFRIDLRQIPVIIGGLYLGFGPWLAVLTIIIRGLFYGFHTGFIAATTIYSLYAILLWVLHPLFMRLPVARRVRSTILFTAFMSVITMGVMGLFKGGLIHSYEIWIAFLVIPSLGAGMVSYVLEALSQNDFLQNEMIKSQKMDAASNLAASIAHEIRNPLTSASGFLQLVNEDSAVEGNIKDYVKFALQELHSAEKIISDYLTFTKPSLISIEEMDVNEEIRTVLNVLKPLANMNSVEILCEWGPISVFSGDRQKFRQCLLNILQNGLEAMPNGGILSVTTAHTSKEIEITIQDTGIGMTKEQIHRLGEPFYSIKDGKGTGLGLMVAYSIIRAFQGKWKVASVNQQGTTFVLTFPHKLILQNGIPANVISLNK